MTGDDTDEPTRLRARCYDVGGERGLSLPGWHIVGASPTAVETALDEMVSTTTPYVAPGVSVGWVEVDEATGEVIEWTVFDQFVADDAEQ